MSFVKIQANQATISESQNLMDFEIPEYIQGVDLKESFININYTIDTTETDGVTGVHNFIKLFNGAGANKSCTLFNSSLVRNISLSSSKGGQLESIQRADLINQVVQQFTKNIGDLQGDAGHSLGSLAEQLDYPMDQSRNLITEGSMISSERVGVMRVNLSDVLGLGGSTLNLNQLGSLRVHLEANLNKFTLKEVPTFNGTTIKGGVDSYWEETQAIETGVAGPAFLTLAKTDAEFLTKKNCPFHTGMKVSFVLVGNTGGATPTTPSEVTITSLVWNTTAAVGGAGENTANGSTVTVNFSDTIYNGNLTGAAVTSIKMYPVYAATAVLNYTGAEMVIKSVSSPPVSKGIQYRTYSTIQDFAPASTSMSRTYEIPRNAMASLICFDTASSSTDFSNSFEPNLTSYQLFVDNVGMTDRPVNIKVVSPFTKDPLHNIILEKTLEEMGLEHKNNLDVLTKQITGAAVLNDSQVIEMYKNYSTLTATGKDGVIVLPVIYEQTGQSKLLNIDLTKDNAGNSINLVAFSMIERTIQY